tara:strand:- start:1257 stop:1718 length:462 start_codon:yes stop_codon:yes gene_type:complete
MVRDIDADITIPESNCLNSALNEIIESFHEENVRCLRVPKDEKKIMQCISSGYPVSVVIPVTEEVMEKTISLPGDDSDTFAMLPVLLYGYSSISKKFAALVPLSVYDNEPVVISFSQVVSSDSCDLFVVDIQECESQDEDVNAGTRNESLFRD